MANQAKYLSDKSHNGDEIELSNSFGVLPNEGEEDDHERHMQHVREVNSLYM